MSRIGGAPALARIGLALVAFLLGVWGMGLAFSQLRGHPGLLSANTFRAFQLVVGRFPPELEDRAVPWQLDVARWALPLLTAWTTVALAWRQVRNPFRLIWARRRGEQLVVAGDEAFAGRTVAAECAAGGRVIFWSDAPSERLADAGAAIAPADPATGDLARARGLLLLGASDTANIALAGEAADAVGGQRPKGDPLPVIARVDDLELRRSIEPRFEPSRTPDARVRLVSLPDIAARELFLDRPVDRFRRSLQAARPVWMLGWTPTVERLVLRLLAAGHFRDGGRIAITVIDPDAAAQGAHFAARRPGADALAPIRFVSAPLDYALGDALAQAAVSGTSPVALVVDQADPARALAIALAAADQLRGVGVVPPVHVRSDAAVDPRLDLALTAFGSSESLARPEALLQERHDALARAIHESYLEGRLDDGDRIGSRASMAEWDELAETVRDDNRLVADCYELKLRDLDARLVADVDGSARFALTGDEVEALARAEHDRWMAAKLVEGWRYGTERDDRARLHPDIVDYDALSEAIKDLDRDQIRIMSRLVGRSGRTPRRILRIAVEGRTADMATFAEWLAAEYPDRVPHLIGDVGDASVRAALDEGSAAGFGIELVTSLDLHRLAGASEAEDGSRIRRLALAADTIHTVPAGEASAEIRTLASLTTTDDGPARRRS